jgi:hypothetical protein
MPRINVLTGETPPPTLEAPPAKKKRSMNRQQAAAPRKSILPARDSVIPVHPLLAAISELPDSIFAFLTGKTDGDFKALRSAFKEWAHNHLDYTDWRRAWEGFWRLHGPKFGPQPEPDPSRSAEKVPTAFNKALDPLLTRAFPRNLRRVIAARGDILAFEDAIRGRGEFHRKYELEGYQPLSIEVLPPSMCPAGVPAVAVAHSFVQNGDLMYDPEVVFAVGQTEAWLAYEITQHPVGLYRNAYRDNSLDVAEVRDINGLVSVWARNLSGQGWCKPPREPIGPNVGTLVESALTAAPKIVHFPPQPSGDPVADLLAQINATALPVKQK